MELRKNKLKNNERWYTYKLFININWWVF